MAKTTHLLNDIQIKSWIARGAPLARSDGDGLTFTLSGAGTASWVLRYRVGSRRREVTIGNYPDITLSLAREKARAMRVAIDGGQDPASNKAESKSRAATAWVFRELVTDDRPKVLIQPRYAASAIKGKNYDLNNVVIPKLGARRVDQITPADIVWMIESAKRGWSASKRVLTTASMVFDHAIGRSIIAANPCTGVKLHAIKGPQPPVRQRLMLTEDELQRLLPEIELIGSENAYAFLILMATCVRGIELARARKEHIDLERGTWWVPDEATKTRRGFLVPLVPAVVDWFQALVDLSGDSDYLLPARQERRRRNVGGDTHVGATTLWAALRRAFDRQDIDIRRFTPHDTRSTAKGHLRNMGVSREISELALNHVLRGMEGVYDVREEIPERRLALTIWADFLVRCKEGDPPPTLQTSNIVPFKRVARQRHRCTPVPQPE